MMKLTFDQPESRSGSIGKAIPSIAVGAAVLILACGVYFLVPGLQDPQKTVDLRADEISEGARRSLEKHNPTLSGLAEASKALRQTAVGESLDSESLSRLAESEADAASEAFEIEKERIDELLKTSRQERSAHDSRLSELDPSAEIGGGRRGFPSSPSGMAQAMNSGVRAGEELFRSNDALLSKAAQMAGSGVQESEGTASASEHVHANRVKGMALLQQGLEAQREIVPEQKDAALVLSELARSVADAKAAKAEIEAGRNEAKMAISAREQAVADAKKEVAAQENVIEGLEAKISDLRNKIAAVDARAEAAREEMERLSDRGLDYGNPNGLADFRAAYEKQAAIYREAVSESRRLAGVTVVDAKLEPRGDYASGEFVGDIEYQEGLAEYERDLKTAQIKLAGMQENQQVQESTLQNLETMAGVRDRYLESVKARFEKSSSEAKEHLDRYLKLASSISDQEDVALRFYRQASSSFGVASRGANNQIMNVPQLSPEAMDRSPYSLIQQDKWLPSQIDVQVADASTQTALVLAERHGRLEKALSILGDAGSVVDTSGVNLDEMKAARDEAYETGVSEVEKAVDKLERAGRGLRQHWSLAAAAAGAYYAQAMLGDEEMIRVAIENYQAVVDGRDDEPWMQPYVDRLNKLRNR